MVKECETKLSGMQVRSIIPLESGEMINRLKSHLNDTVCSEKENCKRLYLEDIYQKLGVVLSNKIVFLVCLSGKCVNHVATGLPAKTNKIKIQEKLHIYVHNLLMLLTVQSLKQPCMC